MRVRFPLVAFSAPPFGRPGAVPKLGILPNAAHGSVKALLVNMWAKLDKLPSGGLRHPSPAVHPRLPEAVSRRTTARSSATPRSRAPAPGRQIIGPLGASARASLGIP